MPILKKVKRCYHCGEILQDIDSFKPGFINHETLNKYPDGLLLCNECYNGEKEMMPQEAQLDSEYLKIIDQIKKKKALVVYVVDLFSFEGSFISKINEELKDCEVLAIGNKRDLLPKNIDDNELLEYVRHRLRVSKLSVSDALLTSSTTGYNIDLMMDKIKKLCSDGRDVYFVGATVSGKSTLISEMLKRFKNNTQEPIITYTFPGTSLRGFRIPLGEKTYIYETPGLSITNSLLDKVELVVGHKIMPNNMIFPRSFKLNKGFSILFGSLALIELLEGIETKIDCYTSYEVDLKITRNGEGLFGSALSRHNISPSSMKFRSFADFDVYDIKVVEDGDRDLGILGLGWIHFIGNEQIYRIFVPKGVYVYTTRSKVKKC